MIDLPAAVGEITSLLDELGYAHMLIGGLAVSLWGEPRSTLDVDLSVWVEPGQFTEAVKRIAARTRTVEDAVEFVRRTRVLPVTTSQGVRADIVFAALEVEREMIARASWKQVGTGRIRVASVEDLIVMKLISERAKDFEDARRLLRRFRSGLDRTYLETILGNFAEALDMPDILETYRTGISES
jgi:hypothetical protein